MAKTQHTRRKGEGGGKKRDKSIESSLKFTGVAAGLAKREIKLISIWRRSVHACACVYMYQCVRMTEYSVKRASMGIHSCACVCVSMYVCVLMCVQIQMGKGNVRAKGRPGKHYSPGRDGREMGVWGGQKGRREKKREIQGEMLLSLTTKMEVRQGQTVRDHLTVASCTCVANTSPKIIQGASLLCRATSYTTILLGFALRLKASTNCKTRGKYWLYHMILSPRTL